MSYSFRKIRCFFFFLVVFKQIQVQCACSASVFVMNGATVSPIHIHPFHPSLHVSPSLWKGARKLDFSPPSSQSDCINLITSKHLTARTVIAVAQ